MRLPLLSASARLRLGPEFGGVELADLELRRAELGRIWPGWGARAVEALLPQFLLSAASSTLSNTCRIPVSKSIRIHIFGIQLKTYPRRIRIRYVSDTDTPLPRRIHVTECLSIAGNQFLTFGM